MILKQERLNIGITGTGSLVGQAIIKSIKASEFASSSTLIGMDYFENTVGSFWCDKNFLLPDLLNSQLLEAWENCIFKIIKENNLRILFIGVDFELIHFSLLKDKIEKETACLVIVSGTSVIKIADDKYLTSKFLEDNGLYYPKTFVFEDCQPQELAYPCIIKPRNGYRSRGVYLVHSAEELIARAQTIHQPIVQEYVGNDETEYSCGVVRLGAYTNSIVLKRTLKEGNTSIAVYDHNYSSQIKDYLADIARPLDIFGSCNFQLRLDEDGIPKLFEINARHSGTTYMRALFGFNEVEMIIQYALGLEIKKVDFKEGKVVRFFDEMFIQ